MARLHGRLLVPAVLRPFGEHLSALVAPRVDDLCVAAGCEGAAMPALLLRAAGAGGLCFGVDDDHDALADCAEELSALRHVGWAPLLRCRLAALPLRDGCASVVTSLFALAAEDDPVAALREMLRVLHPRQSRLAVLVWSEPSAVPHIGALLNAVQATSGHTLPLLERLVALGDPGVAEHLAEEAGGSERLEVSRLHDVVRFDGIEHYWAAMSATVDVPQPVDPVREACAAALAPFTAADGTMRIPTEAVLLSTSR